MKGKLKKQRSLPSGMSHIKGLFPSFRSHKKENDPPNSPNMYYKRYYQNIKDNLKDLNDSHPCNVCKEIKYMIEFPKGKKCCYDCKRKKIDEDELDILHKQVIIYLNKIPSTLKEYQMEINDLNNLFNMAEKLYIPTNEFTLYKIKEKPIFIALKLVSYLLQSKGIQVDIHNVVIKLNEKSVKIKLPEDVRLTYPEIIGFRDFVEYLNNKIEISI